MLPYVWTQFGGNPLQHNMITMNDAIAAVENEGSRMGGRLIGETLERRLNAGETKAHRSNASDNGTPWLRVYSLTSQEVSVRSLDGRHVVTSEPIGSIARYPYQYKSSQVQVQPGSAWGVYATGEKTRKSCAAASYTAVFHHVCAISWLKCGGSARD